MINNSFNKISNNGSLKTGLMVCALALAAACGKPGSDDAGDPNKAANSNNTADGNTVSNGNNTANGNDTTAGVTYSDAGKTGPLTFFTYYQNLNNPPAKQHTFGLMDYDYCAFSAAHDPNGAGDPNQNFAKVSFSLPGDGTPIKPGTYTVGAELDPANIGFTGYSVNCVMPYPKVTSGSVTITKSDATSVTGSISIGVTDWDAKSSQGTVKGNFVAKNCPGSTVQTPPANDPAVCPKAATPTK